MSAPDFDPQGIYVISGGGILNGLAAADDPVVQWLWSQLALGGSVDPLDPPPAHRLALRYPGYDGTDDVDTAVAARSDDFGESRRADDPGGLDAAA